MVTLVNYTKEETQAVLDKINAEVEREKALQKAALVAVRGIFFPPLAIMFRVISFVSKAAGGVAAIGLPYGLYSLYKVALQLFNGVVLTDATHTLYAGILGIFPFIAFFITYVATGLANRLSY